MTKKNILVFPCGSEIGLDINHCLKFNKFFEIIGLSSVEDHGKYVYEKYIEGAPDIDNPEIIYFLKKIVKDLKIDAIYPTMDKVIATLKLNEKEIGCKVIASSQETSEICLSKETTYRILKGKIPLPRVYNEASEDIKFPVFLKPKIGYGSRGTKIINNIEELKSEKDLSDKLLLEYLPGAEFTVDCFTDRYGKLRFSKARKRNRIKGGISVNTSYVENDNIFSDIAGSINDNLKLNGAWFFQVKEDSDGTLKLLEVADRFGGSSILSRALGINLPLLTLFNAFDYDIEIIPNNIDAILDRAMSNKYKLNINFETIYVDFDDCLLIENERVNSLLIAFLYECFNQKKKLILLTKHSKDINSSLKRYRLSDLFDKIIHIREDEEKTDFIKEKDAIFIDDSFSERNNVTKSLNIPVFGPEDIDLLL